MPRIDYYHVAYHFPFPIYLIRSYNMTFSVKTQQILSGYFRAACPSIIMFAIQYVVVFALISLTKTHIQPKDLLGSLTLCMITLAATACAFYNPGKKEYLISVAGIILSWILLAILLVVLFIHTGSLSFLTAWHISMSLLITAIVQTAFSCVMVNSRKNR